MGLQVGVLEESFRVIKPRADEFIEAFYNRLFTVYPEAKPLFAGVDMAVQRKKLLAALILVMQHLRNPAALGTALRELGGRHETYGVKPQHYPMVGNALLNTFAAFLDDQWTVEVEQAWTDAYGAIVSLMLEGHRAAGETGAVSTAGARQPAG
jgi:hemoglobin-like flavoprotein